MVRLYALLAALVITTIVLANPTVQIRDSLVRVPFDVKRNFIRSGMTIADFERARLVKRKIFGPGGNGIVNVTVTDDMVQYLTSVGVGSPPTQYTLLIDTGSSNTWVGSKRSFVVTPTSQNTGRNVTVNYGRGFFTGTEFIDQVTIAPSLVINGQSIGVASDSATFGGIDGVLGLGPATLTEGTVSGLLLIPTVTDNLFKQGTIARNQLAISFNPSILRTSTNGELTFGGVDPSRFTGEVTFSTTSTFPARNFWGINQTISYNGETILPNVAGFIDSGSTLLYLPTPSFLAYQSATGGVMDSVTGLLKITSSQFAALKSVFFRIGGRTFEFTANAQIWPRALNTDIRGSADSIYLVIADNQVPIGTGLDFINGFVFLERFYSVFDTTTRSVGFATTPHTFSLVN